MRSFKVFLLAVSAGLACLVAGFVLGQWVACAGESCSFDVDLFGALGTWVGGIGTVLALGFAAVQLRGDIEERVADRQAEAARQREQERSAWEQAQLVTSSVGMNSYIGTDIGTGFAASIVNGANETPVYNAVLMVPPYGLVRAPKLESKASQTGRWNFGGNSTWPNVERAEGQQWHEWDAQVHAGCTLEFEMNGSVWRRRGSGPAERVGAAPGSARG